MTYLIAKRFDQPGCLAVNVEPGKELAGLVAELSKKYLAKGIQILILSNPDTFGEYKPYQFVDSIEKFTEQIKNM